MFIYSLKRIITAIPTLIAISIVIFLILALAPGDPLSEFAANPAITSEVRENIRQSLGLDQPIPVRYVKWFSAFLQGDMGYSFTSRSPVFELLKQRLPATLWVVGLAYLLSTFIAIPLGVIAAIAKNTWRDRLIMLVAFLGFSLPTFFTGLVFIIIFSVKLNWFPSIYKSTLQVKGFSGLIEQIKQSVMPILVLTLYQSAILIKYVRSAIVEELNQEYVKTAYAKGLSKFATLRRHIMRNAMIPVVTLVALDIPAIFTGALVTEQVFRVPGIGSLLIESIYRSDTPVIMAITFIYAILIVIFNLIADLIYGVVDPRIEY